MTSLPNGLPAPAEPLGVTLRLPVAAVVFESGPDRVLARVSGEIDMDDADSLRQDLTTALDSSGLGLDIDLSAVTFMDSSGLHLLVDLNRLALKNGKSLVLTALSRPVARLLELTGADHVLTVRGWTALKPPPIGGGRHPRP
ncbi:STAS domain-containing protein [Streptomyces sp. NPDC056194]|uniref:STAS domain-containing protein n=1 Tax=unclassified Streptomyces TaxID=2593676 RepID=UPI0035DB5764